MLGLLYEILQPVFGLPLIYQAISGLEPYPDANQIPILFRHVRSEFSRSCLRCRPIPRQTEKVTNDRIMNNEVLKITGHTALQCQQISD